MKIDVVIEIMYNKLVLHYIINVTWFKLSYYKCILFHCCHMSLSDLLLLCFLVAPVNLVHINTEGSRCLFIICMWLTFFRVICCEQ